MPRQRPGFRHKSTLTQGCRKHRSERAAVIRTVDNRMTEVLIIGGQFLHWDRAGGAKNKKNEQLKTVARTQAELKSGKHVGAYAIHKRRKIRKSKEP